MNQSFSRRRPVGPLKFLFDGGADTERNSNAQCEPAALHAECAAVANSQLRAVAAVQVKYAAFSVTKAQIQKNNETHNQTIHIPQCTDKQGNAFSFFFCCRTQKRDALGSAKIAVDRAVRGISSIAVVFFSQTAIDPGGVFNGGLVPNCCLLCLIASLSQLCLFASSPACFRFLGDPDWGPLDVFSWPKAYWLTGNLFF